MGHFLILRDANMLPRATENQLSLKEKMSGRTHYQLYIGGYHLTTGTTLPDGTELEDKTREVLLIC